MESVVDWFAENMPSFLTPEAAVFLISMVPILELRGGLLLATLLKSCASGCFCLCDREYYPYSVHSALYQADI